MQLYLGIDGGGSRCRAALADAAGAVLARGEGGPANIWTDPDTARASILAAAAAALGGRAPGTASAVLGLAGANVPGTVARLGPLPFARTRIESDAVIALKGALAGRDGVAAIVGTGSVFAAQRGGEVRVIGGWGLMLGDQGSGARLGRSLLERALLAHDGLAATTPLLAAVLAEAGGAAGLVAAAGAAPPRDFARLAPRIAAAAADGDAAAAAILAEATAEIAAAVDLLRGGEDLPVCLIGGLAPIYRPRLSARYGVRLQAPAGDALDGALLMARGMA